MTPTPDILKPTFEQQRAADPGNSVWVSANAGSGKTHVLVDRLVRLLLDKVDPAAILCITFTKAAAAEMATRLLDRLGLWAIADDVWLKQQLLALNDVPADEAALVRARQLFTLALETPGGLKVQTIHAFCQSLLHLFPVEAGLAPGFEVMDERQSQALHDEAGLSVQRLLAEQPECDVAGCFHMLEPFLSGDRFQKAITAAIGNHRPMPEAVLAETDFATLRRRIAHHLHVDPDDSEQVCWLELSQLDNARTNKIITAFADAPAYGKSHIHVATILRQVLLTSDSTERLRLLRELLFTGGGKVRKNIIDSASLKKNPATAEDLQHLRHELEALVQRHDMQLTVSLTASFAFIIAAHLRFYEARKQARGVYDFSDLIARAADLLGSREAAQWVMYKLDGRISHILVDEAQDTNPVQWGIISALSEEFFAGTGSREGVDRTLFVVGDKKQSIFSFQGADAGLFEKVRPDFAARIRSSKKQFHDVKLHLSYRSVGDILDVVNAVFTEKSLLCMGFAQTDGDETHSPHRMAERGIFELWPVVEPLDAPEPSPWTAPVDVMDDEAPRKRLAHLIATKIKSWIGLRVLTSKGRAVRADDILILLQRRSALFNAIISELRRAGVAVAGADRLQLRESLAVQDLLALAQFMLLPGDDYSLACVLKSPLLATPVTEEELFELAHGRAAATLWERLQAADSLVLQDQVNSLKSLLTLSANAGPHQFFATVMVSRRKSIVGRLGPEAVDATDAFLDLALDYESQYNSSLAGFIAWFTTDDIAIKREMDKPSGEVRIMTVHGSKGLESRIVILPDATELPTPPDTGFVVDDDGLPVITASGLCDLPLVEALKLNRTTRAGEERLRLLYVAMTRASDELYICGSRSKDKLPEGCWYNIVLPALAQLPMTTVIDVAQDSKPVLRYGVTPEWFDIPETSDTEDSAEPVLQEWTQPVSAALQARCEQKNFLYSSEAAPNDAMRRGTALHKLLQAIPDWETAERQIMARRLARDLGLVQMDADAAVQIVERPDLTLFFGPESQGEVEITSTEGPAAGKLLRIDRLALTATTIAILDYKTGSGNGPELDENHAYVQQLATYAAVLRQVYPGRDVRAALLWTDSGRVDWLSPGLMSLAVELAMTRA